jgi:hypothetical protein
VSRFFYLAILLTASVGCQPTRDSQQAVNTQAEPPAKAEYKGALLKKIPSPFDSPPGPGDGVSFLFEVNGREVRLYP